MADPFPAYKRQPVKAPEAMISGLALNVTIPDKVIELLSSQHDQIQELTRVVAALVLEHQATTRVLMKIAQQQPPSVTVQTNKKMKRTPVRDVTGRIEYVIDEEV